MAVLLLAALLPVAGAVSRAATVAGTTITNIAGVTLKQDGNDIQLPSNPAAFRVEEDLDIQLARIGSGAIPVSAGIVTAVPFELTNAGNGNEAFVLSATIAGMDASVQGFAIDRNGDGRYDPAVDTTIGADGIVGPLAPGAGIRLLALLGTSTTTGDGTITIAAHAATGSGRPGTLFAGQGDGGVDAVVGPTTAAATLAVPIGASADPVTTTLVKTQDIYASDGSGRPVHGGVITYTIVAKFAGAGLVTGTRIVDPLPAGADYVPGSLRLDAAALTDAVGDDAGEVDGSEVRFTLGQVTAPATRSVSFQVKIK